jgi:hypothetical protein
LSSPVCIFCLSVIADDRRSVEHVFPEAIGGSLTTNCVCKPCNDQLGSRVDVALTDHVLVQLVRRRLGLTGKSGRLPDPLGRGYIREDPGSKVMFRPAPPGFEPGKIYSVPSVSVTTDETGATVLRVRLDAEDAPRFEEIVHKALTRRGLPPLTQLQRDSMKLTKTRTDNPVVTVPSSLDLSSYRRALMKIVYEISCLWLGPSYASDPTADLMRKFIWDDELPLESFTKHPINGTMPFGQSEPLLPLWPEAPDGLIAASMVFPGLISVYVRVLAGLEAIVTVTDSPTRYGDPRGRFLAIDPVTGARRESSLEEEFSRIAAALETSAN